MHAVSEETLVPFLDLAPSHAQLKHRLLDDIAELIDSGRFTNGPQVAEFEDAFAAFCGRETCIGIASGLDALRLALVARGIGPGDEVIVPAATFPATLEAVTQAGARPIPVDVGESDYNIDPVAIESAVTPATRAIMPVHLYGQLAAMSRIGEIAERHGIDVVEDACQAHGAVRDGIGAGSAGVAAAFSFYPGKNLGSFGDAGALVCDDEQLATRVRGLREHGQTTKYRHAEVGYTARLDTIQALVLLRKLPLLGAWNAERKLAAVRYSESLNAIGDLCLPPVPEGSDPVWHLYVVRTNEPEAFSAFLLDRGVQTGRHYPEPVHLTGAYAHLGYDAGSFPVAERLCHEAVSLPMFPGISEAQQTQVVGAIEDYYRRG